MANVLLDDYRALRACFLYEFLQGHKAAVAHRNLCRVIGEGSLHYDVVKFWFRRFKSGDYNLENKKPIPGRPRLDDDDDDDDVDCEDIDRKLVKEPTSSIRELSLKLELANTKVQKHLFGSGAVAGHDQVFPNELSNPRKTAGGDPEEQVEATSNMSAVDSGCSDHTVKEEAMEEEVAPSTQTGTSDCTRYPTLLQASTSDAQPTPSETASESAPDLNRLQSADEGFPGQRRQYHINLTGEIFRGEVEASKRGVYPVVKYPIPGGELCYAFEQVRTTKRGLVILRCTGCRKKGTTNSIAVQNGCEFIGNPALLPHVCVPLKNAKDKVTRMVYQSCQAIATEPELAETKPNQLWQSIAQFIDDNAPDDEKQRKMMLKHFYKEGYKSRRTTIARAAAKLHRAKMMKGADAPEDGARNIQTSKNKKLTSLTL